MAATVLVITHSVASLSKGERTRRNGGGMVTSGGGSMAAAVATTTPADTATTTAAEMTAMSKGTDPTYEGIVAAGRAAEAGMAVEAEATGAEKEREKGRTRGEELAEVLDLGGVLDRTQTIEGIKRKKADEEETTMSRKKKTIAAKAGPARIS